MDARGRLLSTKGAKEFHQVMTECDSSLASASITRRTHASHEQIVLHNRQYFIKFYILQIHWKFTDLHFNGFNSSQACVQKIKQHAAHWWRKQIVWLKMPDFAGYVVISLSIISTFSQSVVKPYKKQFLDFFSLSSRGAKHIKHSDDDDNLSWTFSNGHGLLKVV